MTLCAQSLSLPGRLSHLTATVRPGTLTAICGPNGAGKSTLLSCLAGLLTPFAGTVTLDGARLDTMAPRARARRIGYLPQAPEAAWDVTVEVLVGLGRMPWQGAPLHRAHSGKAEDRAAVDAALVALDLEQFRHRALSSLSGGERARAHVARILAGQPDWLLADEPLANLDLAHAASLISRFKAQAEGGNGVVLVVHDLAMAMNHADRVLVLDRGTLLADGPPAEALSAGMIARVWGVSGRWLGAAGAQALVLA